MISKAADFGRIIGASVIFYGHVGIFTDYPLWRWGEYAVAFFILLSGVAYIGFSSVKPTDLPSYRRYIRNRISSTFPILLAINCAIFLVSFCHPSGLGRPFTLTESVLSSTGLSQYFDRRYLSQVMWFFPFVIQAYLIFPLIDAALNRVSGVFVIAGAFVASLLLTALAFSYAPLKATDICRNWSVVFRLPEVCVGLIAGRCIFHARYIRQGLAAIAVFVSLSFILAKFVSPHFEQQTYILSLPRNGIVMTFVIAVISAVVTLLFRNSKQTALFRTLGTASFPFFLAHGVAILFVFRRFGTAATAWVLYFILCWCAAILFMSVFQYAARAFRQSAQY